MKIKTRKVTKDKFVGIKFNLPLAEIARKLGVSRQLVWGWAHGRSKPRSAMLKKLEEIGA